MNRAMLTELLNALPEWQQRLHKASVNFSDHGQAGPIAPINPISIDTENGPQPMMQARGIPGRRGPPSLPEGEVAPKLAEGTKKMNAKPGAAKPKFSRLTGPEIMYDGDAQVCLFDCWTQLNSLRGGVRKEMMALKRKRVMALPPADYGYGGESEDDELEADVSEDEDDDSEEARLRREEEEREKAEAARKQAEEDRKTEFLQFIDSRLDLVARACESAAVIWLKGDGRMGHVIFMCDVMDEAMARIRAELGSTPAPKDEGFEEASSRESDEHELRHKKAGQGIRSYVPTAAARPGRRHRYEDFENDLEIKA